MLTEVVHRCYLWPIVVYLFSERASCPYSFLPANGFHSDHNIWPIPSHSDQCWFLYFMCIANTKVRFITSCLRVKISSSCKLSSLSISSRTFCFFSCSFVNSIVIIEPALCLNSAAKRENQRLLFCWCDRICINSLTHWWLYLISLFFSIV